MRTCGKSALFIIILVQFCRAVDLNCMLTGSDEIMIYSLDKSLLPENQSSCDFSWSNASNVLANHKNHLLVVMKNSLDTLQTSECFAKLNWKAQCTSEKTGLIDFTANCTTNCNDLLHEDKDGHSALGFIALPILAVLAAATLIVLLYKYRKKICSGSTGCSQCGGLYTSVKTQNTDPRPVEIVVENE